MSVLVLSVIICYCSYCIYVLLHIQKDKIIQPMMLPMMSEKPFSIYFFKAANFKGGDHID